MRIKEDIQFGLVCIMIAVMILTIYRVIVITNTVECQLHDYIVGIIA